MSAGAGAGGVFYYWLFFFFFGQDWGDKTKNYLNGNTTVCVDVRKEELPCARSLSETTFFLKKRKKQPTFVHHSHVNKLCLFIKFELTLVNFPFTFLFLFFFFFFLLFCGPIDASWAAAIFFGTLQKYSQHISPLSFSFAPCLLDEVQWMLMAMANTNKQTKQAQNNTIQHNTTQYNITQYNTKQRNISRISLLAPYLLDEVRRTLPSARPFCPEKDWWRNWKWQGRLSFPFWSGKRKYWKSFMFWKRSQHHMAVRTMSTVLTRCIFVCSQHT